MNGIKTVFWSLAAIFALLGGASLYMYFAKGIGTPLSGVASLIMAIAMILIGRSIAAKMEKKE